MSTTDVSLTDLLIDAFESAQDAAHGPLIGKVDAYNPATFRADVTPILKLYVADEAIAAPKLQQIPVTWQGGTTYSITWPLKPGDFVVLEPLGADHSGYLASGVVGQAPPSRRRLSLSDIVARPIPPWSMAAPPTADQYAADGFVLFGPKVYLGGSSAADFAALASKVLSELQAIRTWANSHIHVPGTFTTPSGPVTGFSGVVNPGPVPPSNAMPAPGSVASARVAIKDP